MRTNAQFKIIHEFVLSQNIDLTYSYDADTKEWKVLMGMNKARYRHAMITWKGQLFVTGSYCVIRDLAFQ